MLNRFTPEQHGLISKTKKKIQDLQDKQTIAYESLLESLKIKENSEDDKEMLDFIFNDFSRFKAHWLSAGKHKFIFHLSKEVRENLSFDEFASIIILRVAGVKIAQNYDKLEKKETIISERTLARYKKEINKNIAGGPDEKGDFKFFFDLRL